MTLNEVIAQVATDFKADNPDRLAANIVNAIKAAGYAIVPVEPTEAMIEASGCECGLRLQSLDEHKRYVREDYKAMIKAATEQSQ